MTPRSETLRSEPSRRRFGAAVLAAAGAAALAGCDPRQAMYFLQPFEPKIPAPCPSLKGKRVVILCSSTGGLSSDNMTIDREVAKRLGAILKEKVKKIDLVSTDEVATWAQAKPTWTDPAEAAKAFDADVVIFLEIREFQVQSPISPGLVEGRSNIHIQAVELVYPKDEKGRPMTDQPKESKIIHEGDRATNFPVTGPIPIEAGVNPTVFRNRFLEIVVNEVSWHFVEHSQGDNIQNTRFNE